MVRKTVPSGKKKYIYYVCAAHKVEKTCFAHSLRDSVLEDIVLELVKKRIQEVIDLSELLEMTSVVQLQKAMMRKLRERLAMKEAEINRYQKLLQSLYENLADGLIDREEYQDLKKTYSRRRTEAEEQAESIRDQMGKEMTSSSERRAWMEQFRRHQNITALDRPLIVTLVERIFIYREHRLEIVFRWQDEFMRLRNLLLQAQALSDQEAV